MLISAAVGIATDCGLDGRGSILGRSKQFFSTPQCPARLWDPPGLLYDGYWGFSPGVERPGREADNSPLSSAESWSCTSTPPYVFMT
jgi:hypothetical protein